MFQLVGHSNPLDSHPINLYILPHTKVSHMCFYISVEMGFIACVCCIQRLCLDPRLDAGMSVSIQT